MGPKKTLKTINKVYDIFHNNHGFLRTSQALKFGISSRALYEMRDAGLIIQENRGLYRHPDYIPPAHPDLVQVALLFPKAVICLISALAFHNLTTQIPNRVYIALPRRSQRPRLRYPVLDVIWLPKEAYSAGIEEHVLDNVAIRVYSREKTLADCFRYEDRVGKDVILEALKEYKRQRKVNIPLLMQFARVDRVENKILPYLEAIL